MSTLALVAASGLAREVLAALRGFAVPHDVLLLDDDPDTWGTDVGGVRVAGGSDLLRESAAQVVVCAGPGRSRAAIVDRLSRLGVTEDRYATVVDPTAVVGAGSSVGPGSVLLAGVVLTADVTVGRHVVAMPGVVLTHDDVVEDFATLAAGATLGGGVRVGRTAYLGMRSSVREGRRVGPGATLGMGAALVSDLPADEVWAGVPARALQPGTSAMAEVLEVGVRS